MKIRNNKAKRAAAFAIALLLMLTMAGFKGAFGYERASAAETAPKNHLTKSWSSEYFAGKIEETEEDGVKVTTYTPQSAQPWFSPSLSIMDDIKTMAGDKSYVEIVITFEIRGVFKEGSHDSYCDFLLRAINPRTGGFNYPETDTMDWDGAGSTWDDLYYDAAGGDTLFKAAGGGGNVMYNLMPEHVEIFDDQWTLFESEPIFVDINSMTDELFGDWIMCAHQIAYDTGLKSLQFRNEGLYNIAELATPVPTKAPTAEPTEVPTKAPDTSTAQPATDKPADNATAVPTEKADKGDNKSDDKKGVNPGVIIGIVCGVAAIAVVVIAIVVSKKKKK